MKLHYRISILIAASLLTPLLLLIGCGARADVDVTASNTTGAAEAGHSEAVPVTTAPTTAAAKIIEIEDMGIDPDFIGVPGAVDSSGPPVAVVAGLRITQPEFKFMLNSYKNGILLNSGFAAGSDEDVYFWARTSSNGTTRLEEARGKVLTELQKLKVCAAIAADRGISLDQDELENINTDFVIQQDRYGGREEFESVLMSEYGITLRDYWDLNALVTLREKLLASERDLINISDGEVREYYDGHKDLFDDLVRIRQILFLNEGGDIEHPRTDEETQALAEATLKDIRGGGDMVEMAKLKSDETNAGSTGGLHIVTRSDDFEPKDILDWAFDANVGDYVIIDAAYGLYVVSLEDKIVRNFESLKDDIRNTLIDYELSSHVADWLNSPAYAIDVNEEVLNSIV